TTTFAFASPNYSPATTLNKADRIRSTSTSAAEGRMPGLSFSARCAIAFLLLGVAVAHAQQTHSQAGNKSSSYFAKVAASQPSRSESAQAGKTNRAPLRLLPRSENNRESHGGLARPAAPAFNQAAGTVVASLAIVLGLLFALVWG